MVYNVESNITKIVEKYESLLTKFTGGKMKLLPFARAATPYSLQESEIKSPQRGNIAGNEPARPHLFADADLVGDPKTQSLLQECISPLLANILTHH